MDDITLIFYLLFVMLSALHSLSPEYIELTILNN